MTMSATGMKMKGSAVQPTPVSVKDLELGLKNLSMTVIVLDVWEPCTTKEGYEVRTVRVADKTGSVNMTVWDERGRLLQPSDIIRLNKAYVNHFKGFLTLCISKDGDLLKTGEFCFLFSEFPNMSETKLVNLIPGAVNSTTLPEYGSASSGSTSGGDGGQNCQEDKFQVMSDDNGPSGGNQGADHRDQDDKSQQGPPNVARSSQLGRIIRKRRGGGGRIQTHKIGQLVQRQRDGGYRGAVGQGRRGVHRGRGYWGHQAKGILNFQRQDGHQSRPFHQTAFGKPFRCDQCSAKFSQKYVYISHLNNFHKKGLKGKDQKGHWKSGALSNQRWC